MDIVADLGFVALVTVMVGLVGAFTAIGARASGRDPADARRLGVRVVAALTLWLALVAILAWRGVFAAWGALPPRVPLLPALALIGIVLTLRRPAARVVLAGLPRDLPIAAQTFRIGVELALVALHADGRAPVQVTWHGQNFDVLVGLTAPLIAWLVRRQRASPGLVIGWNVAGLLLVANAARCILTSVPGPLHHDGGGLPFTAIATWPVVWLPAFLAPLAVGLHVASIRQALAARR